jgi:hypothetical protein
VDLQNARALGNALLAFMLVPWCLTLLLYTGDVMDFALAVPCCGIAKVDL